MIFKFLCLVSVFRFRIRVKKLPRNSKKTVCGATSGKLYTIRQQHLHIPCQGFFPLLPVYYRLLHVRAIRDTAL